MRAEAIALHRSPGHFQAGRTAVARSYAVHPVVIRREVSSGPAEKCHVHLSGGIEHVAAESVRVRERRAFFEDAAIDAPAEVLDEVPIDQRVDVSDHTLGFDLDAQLGGCFYRCPSN